MKKLNLFHLLSIFSLFLFCQCQSTQSTRDVLQYVDPFIGTDGIVHTFPGATSPFGMIQLSPDGDITGWNWCSGYHTSDTNIMGFSHTHLSGTGWSDLGDILVMPTVGKIQFQPGSKSAPDKGYRSRISHDKAKEKASAGYYSVELLDYHIQAELTASPRVGFHRYTYPESKAANIIFDPTHKIFGKTTSTYVKAVDSSTIEGYCKSTGWGGKRTTYFVAQLSKPFSKVVTFQEGKISATPIAKAKDAKIAITFSTKAQEKVTLKVALSMVDMQGARNNFKAEAVPQTFNQALAHTQQAWQKQLSAYQFESKDTRQLRMLYTGLYHAMIQPNLFQDVDGRYWALGKKHSAPDFVNYSTFSLWDTFRAVHPLFTITDHQLTTNVVRSLVSRYENGGQIPLWELCGYDNTCMISYPAVSVISDAILKNIPGINAEKALEAMIAVSNYDYYSSSDGVSGVEAYNKFGYVPAPIHASVSKTAENSYYDWCIAQVAQKIGKKEIAATYQKRALRFMSHLDRETGLLLPKDSLGNILPVDLHDWKSLLPHYVSGNIWAYSYFYPHAVDTVIAATGGKEKYIARIDSLLNTPIDMKGEQHVDISGFFGSYGHGDEPGHHFIYLYNKAGETWKIADIAHRVVDEVYNDTRNSMANNDDCGQMSCWQVFTALGFYPLCPGDNQYLIGAPMLPKATIKTAVGTTFTMIAHGYSPQNRYIQSAKLNGKSLTRGYITYQEIMQGSTLEFTMSSTPNKTLFQ
jgi:predicted alpha-1,2-mannosidase